MDQINLVNLMSWLRQTTFANLPLIDICVAVAAALVAYLAMTLLSLAGLIFVSMLARRWDGGPVASLAD